MVFGRAHPSHSESSGRCFNVSVWETCPPRIEFEWAMVVGVPAVGSPSAQQLSKRCAEIAMLADNSQIPLSS